MRRVKKNASKKSPSSYHLQIKADADLYRNREGKQKKKFMRGPGEVGVVDLLLAVLPPLVAVVVRREGVHLPHALLLPAKVHSVRKKISKIETAAAAKHQDQVTNGSRRYGTSNSCEADASSERETLLLPSFLPGV
jgi:hypothetical protein